MKNWRHFLIFFGFAIFLIVYGSYWAYQTFYAEPRKKIQTSIEEAQKKVESQEQILAVQQQRIQWLSGRNDLGRSLPQPLSDGQNLYHTWLLELTAFCQFEDCAVNKGNIQRTASYFVLPYSIRMRCSFEQLSRFLWEFSWAPYLHKITAIQIQPIEQTDLIEAAIQVEGIIIPPLQSGAEPPLKNRLPEGFRRRLSSGPLETYIEPILSRNLLQFSRGGVDDSDFARVTAINRTNGVPEVWISLLTNGSKRVVKTGESFRIGSFFATLVEIDEPDVIFETRGLAGHPPLRWVVSAGEYLKDAAAVPPEH
ncbi:MAG: hypothetical protein LBQ54_11650 [Planctomycetaceae bacterium]|jgi:hypothetical protein|nr:hypothetical protein [Planctomycetaceae bacterium]